VLGRLLGIGAVYGLGFMLIKSLFPEPFLLLIAQGDGGREGNLTVLALVYMLSGLIGGLLAAPIFGLFLLGRKGAGKDAPTYASGANLGVSFGLSMGVALLAGVISALLVISAYAFGLLPPGGVLDPLRLIRTSNFAPGIPLLLGWTVARELLPALLAGLFLAPIGGGMLYKVYARNGGGDPKERSTTLGPSERYRSYEEE
jgi:MFS family permease